MPEPAPALTGPEAGIHTGYEPGKSQTSCLKEINKTKHQHSKSLNTGQDEIYNGLHIFMTLFELFI